MCNWRRSMKYSYQASRIIDKAIGEYPNARFLFLTLTMKNVDGEELSEKMTEMTKGFTYTSYCLQDLFDTYKEYPGLFESYGGYLLEGKG